MIYICNLFVRIIQKKWEWGVLLLVILVEMPIHMFGVFWKLERIYNKDMGDRY